MKKRKNLFKTLFSITGVVIIAKVLGFLKQVITASKFGASIETDIISLSEGFISNADYAIVQTLTTAFVATYIHINSNDKEEGKRFVSDSFKMMLVLSSIIALIFVLMAPIISKILAPTYTSELSSELSLYIRIFAPLFVLVIIRAIFQALLNANDRYIPGEMTSFNQSVVIMLVILLTSSFLGVNSLVVASYASDIVNLLFLLVCAKSYLYFGKGNPLKNSNIISMTKMMGPLLLGYSMIFINQQVDKIIVSSLEPGTVTAMHYGQVLSNLVCTLITSFCTVLFTKLTYSISEGDIEKASDLAIKASLLFFIVFAPISIITIIWSGDIVQVTFGHGAFNNNAVRKAALALSGYGFMFVFYSIKGIFLRFQYGNKNTKTPMINNSIGICVNIILSIILSRIIGLFGVTLASSIAEGVSALLNIISVKKHTKSIKIERTYFSLILSVFIGIIFQILVCVFMKYKLVLFSNFTRLVIVTIICFLIYFGIVFIPLYKTFISKKFKTKNCDINTNKGD